MAGPVDRSEGPQPSLTPAGPTTAGEDCRWRPVSLAVLLPSSGLPARYRRGLLLVWLAFTAACVASSVLMVLLDWTGIPVQLGPVRFYLTVYPPLVLCTWALFWLGFPWAFAAAYLATFVGALVGGMTWPWALLFALADPIGLAMYALAYRTAPLRHDLRTAGSLAWFLLISLGAALAGSSGSFIWAHTREMVGTAAFAVWEGWWIGAFLQAALINAPVLALASAAVVRLRGRWLDEPPLPKPSLPWTVGAVLAGCGVLALFIWASASLASERLVALAASLRDAPVGAEVMAAADSIDLVVWHYLILLTVVGVGVLLLAMSWNRSLRREVALRTADLEESRQRYALAARGANDGLWDWDLRSGTIYFSARWQEMLGLGEHEVGDRLSDWLELVHPADREPLKAALDAHREERTSHFEGEYRLRHRDGTYRWMLTRGACVRDSRGEAVRMAGSQTDITDRKTAEEQMLHDALHDQLTGLPNRALFVDRLEGTIARAWRHPGYLFAVLFLDLDRFKVVNDSLGHAAGDRLLVAIAARLTSRLRAVDTVARLGGDEFAILLDDVATVEDATDLADRIQHELELPFDLDGTEVFTSASIGIATSLTGYQRAEDVLRDADTAMYRAKSQGKARHQLFDTAMHARVVSLLLLETDLRRAVEQRDFTLKYQPIVDLCTRATVGLEALIRWRHAVRGSVPREEFLSLAEETGLILPIGWWALETATKALQRWRSEGLVADGVSVSVNLSGRQLAHPELLAQVDRVLEEAELEPTLLRLEITESAVIENRELAAEALERIKARGVKVDIDDFGTGYSSLSYLHRLPVDRVKIDRSFVRSIPDKADSMEIVRAIVGLADTLGLDSVAEGVETEEQAALLVQLGCRLGQGYLYARPLSADELGRHLSG